MKVWINNWTVLLILLISISLSAFLLKKDLFIIDMLLIASMFYVIYLFSATFHEIGHILIGKILGYNIVILTTPFGILVNGNWRWIVPVNYLSGYSLIYKPVIKGRVKRSELLVFFLSGSIFNLLLVIISLILIPLNTSLPSIYVYLSVFINGGMIFLSLYPSNTNDGYKVMNILLKRKDEEQVFQVISYMYDEDTTSEETLEKLENYANKEEITKFAYFLGLIEKNTRNFNTLNNIKEVFTYKNKDIDDEIKFYGYIALIINFKYESKEQREFFVYYFENHDNKLHKSLYNLLKKRKEYNVVEKEMKYVNAIEKRIIKNLVNLIEKSHNFEPHIAYCTK